MKLLLAPAATLVGLGLLAGSVACTSRDDAAPASTTDAGTSAATSATASETSAPASSGTTVRKATELSTADLVKLAEPAIVRIATGGGVGSGFLISEDGYLVTNNHVVLGRNGAVASSVNVTLSDGASVPGRVVGADARADLALVKIDGGPYKALKIGKLDDVVIGQDVVAIGYALDLKGGEGPSFSVTRGIISQKNRAIDERAPILGAIQTDAAINHGNSGGPLLSLDGLVVGVNTALAPDPTNPNGTASGIGFAVGADTIRAVAEEIRATGKVARGFLGISDFEALRPARARDLGIPNGTQGIYLAGASSVTPTGPAAAAGIRTGDVITKINGLAIRSEADLAIAMITADPNQKVEVELYRGSEKRTITVTLGTPPAQ